jgi:hypothetical protein
LVVDGRGSPDRQLLQVGHLFSLDVFKRRRDVRSVRLIPNCVLTGEERLRAAKTAMFVSFGVPAAGGRVAFVGGTARKPTRASRPATQVLETATAFVTDAAQVSATTALIAVLITRGALATGTPGGTTARITTVTRMSTKLVPAATTRPTITIATVSRTLIITRTGLSLHRSDIR